MTPYLSGAAGTVVRMLRLLFLVYPAVEIVTLVLLGRWVGFGWVFPALLLTPVIGFLIARALLRRMRSRIPSQRSDPAKTDTFTAEAAVTLLACLLLVIPGIATFIIGLVVAVPPVRTVIASRLGRSLGLRVISVGQRFAGSGTGIFTGRGRNDGDAGWGEVIDHRAGEAGDGGTVRDREDPPGGHGSGTTGDAGDPR